MEGITKVTPDRLKVLIGLGSAKEGVTTAEELEGVLGINYEAVMEALDGLWDAGVVADVDFQEFYLTEYGSTLFDAVYDAIGAVLGEDR